MIQDRFGFEIELLKRYADELETLPVDLDDFMDTLHLELGIPYTIKFKILGILYLLKKEHGLKYNDMQNQLLAALDSYREEKRKFLESR